MNILIALSIIFILIVLLFVTCTINDFRVYEYPKIKKQFDNEGFTKFNFRK